MKTTNANLRALKKGRLNKPNIAVFTAGSYTPGLKMYDDLAAASFTTVVLWSSNVDTNGYFHFHNFGSPDVLASNGIFNPGNNPNMTDWRTKVLTLKEPNTTITRVELSIGTGANNPQSFNNIQTIYANKATNPQPAKNLIENLKVLKEKLQLDAICFDDETQFYLDSCLWLAQECGKLGMTVSISPCFDTASTWVNLVQAANKDGKHLIDAVYLQAWSTSNGCQGWDLNGINPTAGVWLQNPNSPYAPFMTPNNVTTQLLNWQETTPETILAGGWFYNANEVFVNVPAQMKEYSDAMWAAFFAI